MSTQTPIDLWRAEHSPRVEIPIHLLVEIDPELARWRRRALFLASLFLHIFLVLLIVFAPDLFRRGKLMMGIPVNVRPSQQITTLFLPPDLLKSLREPPPEARNLSDKNRRAQGRAPTVDPNGIHAPYSRGNTELPEIARGGPPLQAGTGARIQSVQLGQNDRIAPALFHFLSGGTTYPEFPPNHITNQG
jgi:hypothetical protein